MSTAPHGRGAGPAAWLRDLALGMRLARSGGRGAWTRTAMTTIGVGLGVALLLFAAAVPSMYAAREDRSAARTDMTFSAPPPRSDATVLVADAGTTFRGTAIRGRLLQPEGPRAPLPPGVARFPAAGEIVVSPALAERLRSQEGELLRTRLPYRVVGEIGHAGLEGPGEYAYYLGSDRLAAAAPRAGSADYSGVRRIDHFGGDGSSDGLDPVLALLAAIAFAALLLPVAVFIGAAVRFGGEARDRRLAALRLVGADARMARRIAAGEALLGALLGLVLGALMFLLGRQLAERIQLRGLSAFAADMRPSATFALLIAVAVPAAAVVVTLIALRGAVIEPLGVTRQAQQRRRRLWWRLLVPLAGVGLLAPLSGSDLAGGGAQTRFAAVAGVLLLLVGIATLLPWVVETVVHRLGGGGVAWQLATRRLQLDSGTSARVVSGIAVAVAGAIALTTLFSGVEAGYSRETGADTRRAQASGALDAGVGGPSAASVHARLGAADGVRSVTVYDRDSLTLARDPAAADSLTVADCAVLRELARIGDCADGDAFAIGESDGASALRPGQLKPGARVRIADRVAWRVPSTARLVRARETPDGGLPSGVLATPGALAGRSLPDRTVVAYAALDPARPDALEQLRNAGAAIDPRLEMYPLSARTLDGRFANLRRGLFIGAVAVLMLIGASMLVSALEQLRERRRLIAALVAFGTPRATLAQSLLWQAAVPVALGLALAVVTGGLLGAMLLRVFEEPVSLDLAAIGGMTAVGAAVVLLVTALSLPALRRLTRPDGLRTE